MAIQLGVGKDDLLGTIHIDLLPIFFPFSPFLFLFFFFSHSPPSHSSSLYHPLSICLISPCLPQVHIFSYQCSQLSTPESVIEVFKTAQRFQRNQDTTKYVSVVVLDEVGLAEDSPNLPLKALHPLLEDGTEGADDKQEVGRVSIDVEW